MGCYYTCYNDCSYCDHCHYINCRNALVTCISCKDSLCETCIYVEEVCYKCIDIVIDNNYSRPLYVCDGCSKYINNYIICNKCNSYYCHKCSEKNECINCAKLAEHRMCSALNDIKLG